MDLTNCKLSEYYPMRHYSRPEYCPFWYGQVPILDGFKMGLRFPVKLIRGISYDPKIKAVTMGTIHVWRDAIYSCLRLRSPTFVFTGNFPCIINNYN